MARLDAWVERLRLSLWFVPALFAVAAAAAALLLLALDRRLAEEGWAFFRFGGTAEGARSVLSAVAQSMLTFTGLVFTITMLVLQLAANQLSPRVMRTYLRDRQNQVVLGLFVATFLFSLFILREVRSSDGGAEFVPGVSIWVAFALLVASIGAFVYYIDHMAHAIRASTVIASIADEARDTLDRLYPPEPRDQGVGDTPLPFGPPAGTVTSQRAGTLIGIDLERLTDIAREEDFVVEIVPMVGDFVTEDAVLARVRSSDGVPGDAGSERVAGLVREGFTFGTERTMQQDLAFGFRQLVDIGARALSPGTNDPTTAVQALDQVHDLLRRLAQRPFPPSLHRDEAANVRVVSGMPSWDEYVALALDELRIYGAGHLQVTRRIAFALHDLLAIAPADRRGALRDQLVRLEAGIQRDFPDSGDRERAQQGSSRGQGPADSNMLP